MDPIEMGPGSYRKRMHLDVSAEDLKGVEVGSKVRLSVTGVVSELRAPEKHTYPGPNGKEEERITPPSMCVMVDGVKVAVVGNAQIDSIVEDDTAEEEYD